MPPDVAGALTPALRKQLEKAVRSARAEGEAGARAALGALAVGAARPHESMRADERGLRRRLRAHGRQLGDALDRESGEQDIGRLVHEVAYEHWHRMLFARFLAENGLLVEPRSRVSVSLDECAELAREAGAADAWRVAEGFAAEMLPQIFRPDDPALAVTLAPETRQRLERLVEELPVGVFTASDALGWTYQFWQADRKDEVNRAGAKIGADELPAVTQLFTENYMVRFLFHNTIGAWRAGKVLAERPELAEGAASEAELADAVRIGPRGGVGGYDFEYLRFVREPAGDDGEDAAEGSAGPWRPAAGVFGRWPRRTADLRVLDPCCGSGHFLVEGFELLVRLRMEGEGLGIEEAVRAVLRDNLFGLEIDPRCTQIAAFNLALTAWRTVGRPIELPSLQIACSGLAPSATKGDWLSLAEGDQRLEGTLDLLHDLFRQAPVLGSLIDPAGVGEELFQADYATAEGALSRAVAQEDAGDDVRERAVAAQGISRAARLLAGEYDLVITNVPYLARGKQAASLQNFAPKSHPDAKADLAAIFVSRIFRWLGTAGVQAVVAPQNWLFLTSYRKLRERLLSDRTWRFVARLGPGAFETIGGHVVNVAMAVLSAESPDDDWRMAGIDVSAPRGEKPLSAREKAEVLAVRPDGFRFKHEFGKTRALTVAQRAQLLSPDARVSLRDAPLHEPLQGCASSVHGLGSKDTPCFFRQFWEVASQEFRRRSVWEPLQTTVDSSQHFGGAEQVVLWEQHSGLLAARGKRGEAVLAGRLAWGSSGGDVPPVVEVGE